MAKLLEKKIDKILCHKLVDQTEFYLVKWKARSHAPASWHSIHQFYVADKQLLAHLQSYVDLVRDAYTRHQIPAINKFTYETHLESLPNEFLTFDAFNCQLKTTLNGQVYGVPKHDGYDSSILPTAAMKAVAIKTPTRQADKLIRHCFETMLREFNHSFVEARPRGLHAQVRAANAVNGSSPSLNFTLADEYTFYQDSDKPDLAFLSSCESCKPNMAHNNGCEYTQTCGCLEYADVDTKALERNPALLKKYKKELAAQKANPGYSMKTMGMPKKFPYSPTTGLLVPYYLDSRRVIYECNHMCKCGDNCRNKVTVHGRTIPLEIFRTVNRGWGLRCPQDLKRGQFIDFYWGEVVPLEVSDRRLQQSSGDQNSYVFALDKFSDYEQNEKGEWEEVKVHHFDVDGEFYGGPIRFMNHSCEPNCRQFVVTYNKNDPFRYNLALFALEDIPAGAELTFDYIDLDEDEDGDESRQDDRTSVPCLCGTKSCRGRLW